MSLDTRWLLDRRENRKADAPRLSFERKQVTPLERFEAAGPVSLQFLSVIFCPLLILGIWSYLVGSGAWNGKGHMQVIQLSFQAGGVLEILLTSPLDMRILGLGFPDDEKCAIYTLKPDIKTSVESAKESMQ